MTLKVDLNKSAANLRVCLEKAGMITPPEVEVCFDLDVSGSYEGLHRDGTTNALMTRLVPWGLVFDPDRQLDVCTFSDGPSHVHHVGMVNADNYHGFVGREILDKVPGWNGATDFAPVLRKNLEIFGWTPSEEDVGPTKGPWARVKSGLGLGTKTASTASKRRKSLVLFNTDGENNDRDATERLFDEMQKRKYGMYVLFIAVGRSHFDSLRRLSNEYSNVGLCVIEDIKEWVGQNDDEINEELITPKLVEWLGHEDPKEDPKEDDENDAIKAAALATAGSAFMRR